MSFASSADPAGPPDVGRASDVGRGPDVGQVDVGRAPILVVGLGNPLLGDDGVGWRVVEALEERLAPGRDEQLAAGRGDRLGRRGQIGRGGRLRQRGPIEFDCLAVGGLTLMERLVGYERVILIDATLTGDDPPGTISCQPLGTVRTRGASHLDSAHDAPLSVALAAGRALGASLPDTITIVGIEARTIDVFDADLSPAAAAAIPRAVEVVLGLIPAW